MDYQKKTAGSLPDRLRILSEKTGTLKSLAKIADVPYATFMRYMKGTTEPKSEALANIINQLGIDGTWLLTGQGSHKRTTGSPDSSSNGLKEVLNNVTVLPKFSEKTYLDVLNKAESFTTRDLMMKKTSSPIYQSEKDYASSSVMMRLFGTPDPEDIVAVDFHDSRIPNGPVLLYVNVAQLKPKHHQRVLVIQDGRPYLMRGEISGTPPNTTLVDVAEITPIPSVSYEQLVREDAIVGTIEGHIGMG